MKCWIKRSDEKGFKGYFSANISKNQNHWVQTKQEAKEFFDGRKARGIISKYNLKNCEIEYK